ncbi:hypothetical protein, partial [Aurantimonas coralicida]
MTNRPRRSRPSKTRGQTIDLKAEKNEPVTDKNNDDTGATASAKPAGPTDASKDGKTAPKTGA